MTQQQREAVGGMLRVAVTLDVVPGVPHLFQAFAAVLDEGEAALTRAGAFLRADRHSL